MRPVTFLAFVLATWSTSTLPFQTQDTSNRNDADAIKLMQIVPIQPLQNSPAVPQYQYSDPNIEPLPLVSSIEQELLTSTESLAKSIEISSNIPDTLKLYSVKSFSNLEQVAPQQTHQVPQTLNWVSEVRTLTRSHSEGQGSSAVFPDGIVMPLAQQSRFDGYPNSYVPKGRPLRLCQTSDGVNCLQCLVGCTLIDGKCFMIPVGCITFNAATGRCSACMKGLILATDWVCR